MLTIWGKMAIIVWAGLQTQLGRNVVFECVENGVQRELILYPTMCDKTCRDFHHLWIWKWMDNGAEQKGFSFEPSGHPVAGCGLRLTGVPESYQRKLPRCVPALEMITLEHDLHAAGYRLATSQTLSFVHQYCSLSIEPRTHHSEKSTPHTHSDSHKPVKSSTSDVCGKRLELSVYADSCSGSSQEKSEQECSTEKSTQEKFTLGSSTEKSVEEKHIQESSAETFIQESSAEKSTQGKTVQEKGAVSSRKRVVQRCALARVRLSTGWWKLLRTVSVSLAKKHHELINQTQREEEFIRNYKMAHPEEFERK